MGDTDHQPERIPDEQKVFVSRIPKKFTSEHVKRLIENEIGVGTVEQVDLAAESTDKQDEVDAGKEHRGFGFVVMDSIDAATKTIALKSIKGKFKESSRKFSTLYLGPVVHDVDSDDKQNTNTSKVCFLWMQNRCPYGDKCSFEHSGPGGCKVRIEADSKPKRKKCWDFRKGKCDNKDCPFLHVGKVVDKQELKARPKSEKPCINWKTKGRCRKQDTCPYAHDLKLKGLALKKIAKKKEKKERNSQPLSVRVFGLNYNASIDDVKNFFASCGKIVKVDLPVWPDSGRSKGYCQVLFQSPKAVTSACALDKSEMQGRWLQIQAGKMLLEQWSEYENNRSKREEPLTGEFGQVVKKRKIK